MLRKIALVRGSSVPQKIVGASQGIRFRAAEYQRRLFRSDLHILHQVWTYKSKAAFAISVSQGNHGIIDYTRLEALCQVMQDMMGGQGKGVATMHKVSPSSPCYCQLILHVLEVECCWFWYLPCFESAVHAKDTSTLAFVCRSCGGF